MTTASYYLDSDYFKLIDFVSTTDSASKILSPFIFKKILRKEKNSVVTQELVKTPIVNLIQETEFSTQDGNTIIIKINLKMLLVNINIDRHNNFIIIQKL